MPRIKRTALAAEDIISIWQFIASDNLDAAEKWIAKLDRTLKRLASFPGIGQRRDDLQAGLRTFPFGNYIIFYREVKSGIELLRVIHGARQFRSLL